MVPFCGRCTTHLVYFSGDWDVHWGDDLDFDPWPNRASPTASNGEVRLPAACAAVLLPEPRSDEGSSPDPGSVFRRQRLLRRLGPGDALLQPDQDLSVFFLLFSPRPLLLFLGGLGALFSPKGR